MIGDGVVAQALLPLVLKHLRVSCGKIVVIDFEARAAVLKPWIGGSPALGDSRSRAAIPGTLDLRALRLDAAQESFELLDAFREAGGNFVQTSGICPGINLGDGFPGSPEQKLGRWLLPRRIRRVSFTSSLVSAATRHRLWLAAVLRR